jgi:hypothetical protein
MQSDIYFAERVVAIDVLYIARVKHVEPRSEGSRRAE